MTDPERASAGASAVTLRQLEMLVAVAEHGSFSAAADTLGLTQSAASQCLKSLESALGTALFSRSTRRVELTAAGQRMLPALREALGALDGVLQQVRHDAREAGGVVRITCTAATSAYLPARLAEIARHHPGIDLRLVESGRQAALDQVRSGHADLAITDADRPAPGLRQTTLAHDPFVLVCRDDHPFGHRREIAPEHLRYERLVALEETAGVLKRFDARPADIQFVIHPHTALDLVLQHRGVALLPSLSLPATRHPRLRTVPVQNGPAWRLALSTSRAHRPGSTARAIHDLIARVAQRPPARETRPVTLLIPYPPHGPADELGRCFATRLAAATGREIRVQNTTGMGGALGIHMATRAQPDGLTLALAGTGTLIFNPLLATRDMFEVFHDLRFIGGLAQVPNILAVGGHMPARDLRQLLAHARLRPGAWKIGAAGSGISRVLAELFQAETGIALQTQHYEGLTPAVRDLARGEVDMVFGEAPGILPLIATGQAYPIFTAEKARADCLAATPCAAEAGLAALVAGSGYCFVGPAALPQALCDELWAEMSAVLRLPALQHDVARLGALPDLRDGAAYEAHIRREQERWRDVIAAGAAAAA